nr:uncharacterized protein LOC125420644 [Ziziphus jujuba var. spinosa]
MEEICADLRGQLHVETYDVDDEDDDDIVYPPGMDPYEKNDYREAIRASKQSEWERSHLHKVRYQAEGGESSSRAKPAVQLTQTNKVSSHHFKNLVAGCQQAEPGIEPPTPYEINTKYLDMEYEEIKDHVNKMKAKWETYGCTIMCDGWTGPTRMSIINFMVYSKGSTVFLKSIDASNQIKDHKYIYEQLKKIILDVGKKNVVQIVTDNGSAFVKAGKKLMGDYNLYWTPSAAHCIDLMFEDIGKNENVAIMIKQARAITTYIYNHNWLLAKMCETCKGDIIRPGLTRFATNYLALDSLVKKKAALKQLFTSTDWTNHNYSASKEGQTVENIVRNHTFWDQAHKVCQLFEPLYKFLRIVDTEVYPTMGAVSGVGEDSNLIKAVHDAYATLDPKSATISQFGKELTYFKDARKGFARPTAIASKKEMSSVEWWVMYGDSAPTVRKLALKVLSQTASSSAYERNWTLLY